MLALPTVSWSQDVDISGTMPEAGLPALNDILQVAMKQSPGMIQNDISILQAQAGVYAAEHSLWPGVGGGAQYGTNKSSTSGGATSTGSGFFYNIGLSQPVFQWGALANQARIGKIGLLIAKRSYAEAYGELAVSLREQYMGVIQRKMKLRDDRFAIDQAQKALDVARQRFNRGEVPLSQVGEAGGNVDQASTGLAQDEDEFESALLALRHTAGLPRLTAEEIPLSIPKPEYHPELAAALLAGLLRDHAASTFQAQIYEMQIHQGDLSYKIAKVGLFPKFGINTGYSVSNSVTANTNSVTQSALESFSYNASVQWSLFDGFATRGAKLSALAGRRAVQRQLETYIQSTEERAEHLIRALKITEHLQENADASAISYNNVLQRQFLELKLGNVPKSAIASSQWDAYNAELSNMGARANLYSQWCEYVSLVGRDPALDHLPPSYVRQNP